MQLNLDPTIPKVVIVAILIFIYSFAGSSGIMAVLAERMPEMHEWLYYIFFALGADAVYILSFLGFEKPEQK
jgi:hypothetical protein